MPGLVLVVACYSFPYVFVFTKSALDLVSSEMEDAANILGAGNLQHHGARSRCRWCCRRSSGAFILVFLEAIALFGSPALLALPGRFHVVTTQLWQFFEFPPQRGRGSGVRDAAAAASPIVLFWLQRRITAPQGLRVADRQGRRAPADCAGPMEVGRCSATACSSCSLSFFMPMVVICQAALRQGLGPRLLARTT